MRMFMTLGGCCLFALGSAIAQDAREQSHPWIAPPSAETRKNPLSDTPEIRAGGERVYQQRCSVCHSKDGTGTNRGPNLTVDHVQEQSDGALFWKISSGNTRTGMPTFSFLPEAQRWQLVMHVRTVAE